MSDSSVWVALIAAVPASLAAYGGLIAAHRTGSSGSQNRKMTRLVRDMDFIKNIVIAHVTDQRLHPELSDLGPQKERNKRDG